MQTVLMSHSGPWEKLTARKRHVGFRVMDDHACETETATETATATVITNFSRM